MGPTTKDVGIETIEPIINPFNHALKKYGTSPIFIKVIVSDMTSDIINPIKTPITSFLYFLGTFILPNMFLSFLEFMCEASKFINYDFARTNILILPLFLVLLKILVSKLH